MYEDFPRFSMSSKILKSGILLAILSAFFSEMKVGMKSRHFRDAEIVDKQSSWTTANLDDIVLENNIRPGELPGYTGWARPEKTLSRFFSIKSVSTRSTKIAAITRYEYVITAKCEGHKDCVVENEIEGKSSKRNENNDNGVSLFFLRAYGTAVVPGTVTSRSCETNNLNIDDDLLLDRIHGCYYVFTFVFYDPGLYTIEVVLTFSSPPPISTFPLGKESNQEEPHYEGYLLPGFPLIADIGLEEIGNTPTN